MTHGGNALPAVIGDLLTIDDAAAALRRREVSAMQLASASLAWAEATQDTLGAFVAITSESALSAAATADSELARGVDRGLLHGIPIAVKDAITTAEVPATAGGHAVSQEWRTTGDATVVKRLRDAGAVIVGKTGMHENACGWPDPATGFRVVRNPWDLARSPGGSSTGSAAAVAAGIVYAALGTDTGGSVRDPASHSGISGFKPTNGSVSTHGLIPLSFSLDCIGTMGRSARDCGLTLQAVWGVDPADRSATIRRLPVRSSLADRCEIAGLRVGIPTSLFYDPAIVSDSVLRSVNDALKRMETAGAQLSDVNLDYTAETSAAYTVTFRSEAFAYHELRLEVSPAAYGYHSRRQLELGSVFSAADYIHARRFGRAMAGRWERAISDIDVMVTPTIATVAPRFEGFDPDAALDQPELTGCFNLLGWPAMTVPCGFDDEGLPIGMQLVAPPYQDRRVIGVARAYQEIDDVHLRKPPIFRPSRGQSDRPAKATFAHPIAMGMSEHDAADRQQRLKVLRPRLRALARSVREKAVGSSIQ